MGYQVALAQAGARQALHQAVELGDDRAAQAAVIGRHVLQRNIDGPGQLGVFGLLEPLGKTQQAQVGVVELGQPCGGPFIGQ